MALMYRRDDPQMAAAVTRAFAVMAADGELTAAYAQMVPARDADRRDRGPADVGALSEAFRAMGAQGF